jgi:RNA polymerase sigma factor (sigma-70 family)
VTPSSLLEDASLHRATSSCSADVLFLADEAVIESIADKVPLDIARMNLRQYLVAQMDKLPAAQKHALELAYFSGVSQREIARETNAPLGTVKTRLELGMKKLCEATKGLKDRI